MAYSCDFGTGQRIYLENQGLQTLMTLVSSCPGQQQQASNSLTTGTWTAPPEVFQTVNGVVIRLKTNQGDRFLQIQGSNMGILSSSPTLNSAQQIQVQSVDGIPGSSMPPMQPMQPMQPLKPMPPMNLNMGDMQMSMNPMEMRMGTMAMSMGSNAESSRHFCTQCGTAVKPEDRFCAHCGHRLD